MLFISASDSKLKKDNKLGFMVNFQNSELGMFLKP